MFHVYSMQFHYWIHFKKSWLIIWLFLQGIVFSCLIIHPVWQTLQLDRVLNWVYYFWVIVVYSVANHAEVILILYKPTRSTWQRGLCNTDNFVPNKYNIVIGVCTLIEVLFTNTPLVNQRSTSHADHSHLLTGCYDAVTHGQRCAKSYNVGQENRFEE